MLGDGIGEQRGEGSDEVGDWEDDTADFETVESTEGADAKGEDEELEKHICDSVEGEEDANALCIWNSNLVLSSG